MFRVKLRQLLRRYGLTQQQLADAIYVSRSTVAKWLSGRGIPCRANIEALCKYFHVEEAWLFGIEDLRVGAETYENALRRAQKGVDAAFSIWNTVLFFLRISCSVAAILGGFATPFSWLLPVAATSMWDTDAAVQVLYGIWEAWWHFFTLRGLSGGKTLHRLCTIVAILIGSTCGVALYAIATCLVYPPIGGKSGPCRIREALYRLGANERAGQSDVIGDGV